PAVKRADAKPLLLQIMKPFQAPGYTLLLASDCSVPLPPLKSTEVAVRANAPRSPLFPGSSATAPRRQRAQQLRPSSPVSVDPGSGPEARRLLTADRKAPPIRS